MQYLIRVVCDEVDDFRRDILIDEDASFLELSKVLLESCGYPDDQMTSFYICNDEWERGEQVTREDMHESSAEDEDLYTMADTLLRDFLDQGIRNLEYVFDPFNDRVFSLCVRDELPGSDEPEVIKSVGKAPQQIMEIDFSIGNDLGGSSESFDDFGIDSFNSDEIDLEGFEISDSPSF